MTEAELDAIRGRLAEALAETGGRTYACGPAWCLIEEDIPALLAEIARLRLLLHDLDAGERRRFYGE